MWIDMHFMWFLKLVLIDVKVWFQDFCLTWPSHHCCACCFQKIFTRSFVEAHRVGFVSSVQLDCLLVMTTLIEPCCSTNSQTVVSVPSGQTYFCTHIFDNISQTIYPYRFVDIPLFWTLSPFTNFLFVKGVGFAVLRKKTDILFEQSNRTPVTVVTFKNLCCVPCKLSSTNSALVCF